MEEAEVPLEHLHEEIHHRAAHGGERWVSWVALSTAILAVLAAITGLLSGQRANEAMMKQIEASDQWAYYQAKGIKASVLEAKMTLANVACLLDAAQRGRGALSADICEEMTHAPAAENCAAEEIIEVDHLGERRDVVGIVDREDVPAIAAISALTKRPAFLSVSLVFGLIGAVFLGLAFVTH